MPFQKLKSALNTGKSKVVALTGALVGLISSANAEVTFAEGSGFAGKFDLTYFYSAIGIIVTAIAVVAAVGLALRQFRKI